MHQMCRLFMLMVEVKTRQFTPYYMWAFTVNDTTEIYIKMH